jgi:hypothetical protein
VLYTGHITFVYPLPLSGARGGQRSQANKNKTGYMSTFSQWKKEGHVPYMHTLMRARPGHDKRYVHLSLSLFQNREEVVKGRPKANKNPIWLWLHTIMAVSILPSLHPAYTSLASVPTNTCTLSLRLPHHPLLHAFHPAPTFLAVCSFVSAVRSLNSISVIYSFRIAELYYNVR